MGEDDSGLLALDELIGINPEDLQRSSAVFGKDMCPTEIFKKMDVDKSGSLDITDSLDGLSALGHDKTQLYQRRMSRQIDYIIVKINE